MIALHETCLEYFRRRLSEGWKCISLEGHNAVLLSPEGIRRELDLRHDVLTLRPNGAGATTGLNQFPAVGENWDKVDEAVPDEDTTYVWGDYGTPYTLECYALPGHGAASGIINSVQIYHQSRATGPGCKNSAVLRTHGSTYAYYMNGNRWLELTTSYVTYNCGAALVINPYTGLAWTWDEIDALQAGVNNSGRSSVAEQRCTQVYVEVDYTTEVLSAPNAATGITSTSAILNGAIADDLGDAYYVGFQWGRTEDYGNDTPWQPALPAVASFETGDTFSQLITGLVPGTLYHFRAQAKDGIGTVYGDDVAFWTLKPSVGKGYAFSREYHIKRTTDVLDMASIALGAITTLADCRGINLVELPSSLTVTVEATYDASAVQGIEVHLRTSLTDRAIGTHTGADGDAALTDAEANFVVDELIGLTIKNLTDGSSGVITANTATEVTATLVGGTNNDWDASDAYIIEGAGYDTEDWDSFVPAFGAGSSIRQTEHYDVDPVFLKVFVENLDEAEAVTDIKIIIARGT